MKTVILNQPGEFQLIERNFIQDQPDKAVVKIKSIGICGTDYHAFRGKQPFFSYPRVLGHELGGEVVSLGNSTANHGLNIGDKVAVEPYINCKKCQACKSGYINCCENLSVLGVHADGGMSEYLSVPMDKLHVSKTLTFDQLALVETLGIGLHAVNRAKINKNDKVLIIGAGPIGLASTQFAKVKGANVVVADITESRLKFIENHKMADRILVAKGLIDEKQIRAKFDGDLPTVVMDATGNEFSMNNTFNFVAHGGKIVFVGLFQGDAKFFDPNFHKREITLLASRNCLPSDFKEIINLKEKGTIDSSHWITHRTDLDGVPKNFGGFIDPSQHVVKAMIDV